MVSQMAIESLDFASPKAVTAEARRSLAADDSVQARLANQILDFVEGAALQLGASDLPRVHISRADDESLIVEWPFSHHRLGFSIEPDLVESSWFFVSDEHEDSTSACGKLGRHGVRLGLALLSASLSVHA
jgi:hypothetical protein